MWLGVCVCGNSGSNFCSFDWNVCSVRKNEHVKKCSLWLWVFDTSKERLRDKYRK